MEIRPAGYLIETPNSRCGTAPGVFYNYIMAGNGLFIQANNEHFEASVCIAPADVRGLVTHHEYLKMKHGKIPLRFLNLALSILCMKPDIEQYLAVIWQDGYSLAIPNQTQTDISVNYETIPGTVLDIHSHVGDVPGHFSPIDNQDELGFHIYAVASDLHKLCPTVELRLGIYGYFMTISKEDVFSF